MFRCAKVESGSSPPVRRPERNGRLGMSVLNTPPEPGQIRAPKTEDIDFSEIPQLDEAFWWEAKLVEPDRTGQISLRARRSVLQWFTRPDKG